MFHHNNPYKVTKSLYNFQIKLLLTNDSLDLRLKLPQHWYSTDISDDFEEGKLVENGDIVVIEAENSEKLRRITIDVNDGMSIITHYPDGKEIGVKYMDNKDDFEYIGKISELKN